LDRPVADPDPREQAERIGQRLVHVHIAADPRHPSPGERRIDHAARRGGQRQRLAIARAVVARPRLILADEPTGSVDRPMGEKLMRLFQSLNKLGATVLIASHDEALAERSAQLIELVGADGLAIVRENTAACFGYTPGEPASLRLAEWVDQQPGLRPTSSNALSTVLPEASAWKTHASGLLA
ncbi:hypothetical protein LTR94_031576, partial [Friedmanniomyces endolithicus]